MKKAPPNTAKKKKQTEEGESSSETSQFLTDDEILVFQCHKCLTIIGDSKAFFYANKDMKIMTLTAVSAVAISYAQKDLETSREGLDQGSTYYVFRCGRCQSPLGKVYKTTAPELDELRGKFTFDTRALLTYKTGAYQQIATNITLNNKMIPTIQDFHRQEANLIKTQQMILLFKERLQNLEAKLLGDSSTTDQPHNEVSEDEDEHNKAAVPMNGGKTIVHNTGQISKGLGKRKKP